MRSSWTYWSFGAAWLVALAALCLTSALAGTPPVPSLAPSDSNPERKISVNLYARQFEPATLTLTAGQKTKLVFHNLDAELHAFVPIDLLVGVNVNISGNGAPEFGKNGFKRVIIPSQGNVEIRFVPQRPGVYPFYCDMPGHEMRGTIVVE